MLLYDDFLRQLRERQFDREYSLYFRSEQFYHQLELDEQLEELYQEME